MSHRGTAVSRNESWWEALSHDVRTAFRTFRTNRVFAGTAVLTLGLGIAAATSVSSVVDATLLRPLPFAEPARVVDVAQFDPKRPQIQGFGIPRTYSEALRSSPLVDSVAEYASWVSQPYTVARPDGPQVINGVNASPDFFTVFRVRPTLGRALTADDEQTTQPTVCVLTAAGARRLFNGRRDVVGRSLSFVEGELTVVGVMGEAFWYPLSPGTKAGSGEPAPDLLVPFARRSPTEGPDALNVVAARLRPGATVAQIQREVEAIARRHGTPNRDGSRYGVRVRLLQDELASTARTTLLVLLGLTACLLLVCAVNIANLLLSHSQSRTREFALRTTLGAGRARLFRQLLTEHLVLAILGGALGLMLTTVTLNALVRLLPRGLLIVPLLAPDLRVVGLAVLVTVVTGLLAGLAPSLLASRADLAGALKTGGQTTTRAPRWRFFASGLLLVETALLLALLSGGSLLVNTLVRLETTEIGFNPDTLWTAEFFAPKGLYARTADVGPLAARANAALRSLPGVVSVGESDWGILGGFCPGNRMTIDGRAEILRPQIRHVSASYFTTIGMSVSAGALWTAQDENVKPEVAVINAAAARHYWPNEDPLGRRIVVNDKWSVRIVAVVKDLREANEREAPGPSVYLPLNPLSTRFYRARTMVVRTERPQVGLRPGAIRSLAAVDPRLPVTVERTDDTLWDRRQDPRFYAVFVGLSAVFGLLLAAVGIGGITAQTVVRRTREIGVRLALGADVSGVTRLIARQVCAPVVGGAAVGLAIVLALARVMRSFLYEVTPHDPVTHAVAVGLLLTIALAAVVVPARRAATINPVDALRAE